MSWPDILPQLWNQSMLDGQSVMPRDERGRWVRLPRTPARHF